MDIKVITPIKKKFQQHGIFATTTPAPGTNIYFTGPDTCMVDNLSPLLMMDKHMIQDSEHITGWLSCYLLHIADEFK